MSNAIRIGATGAVVLAALLLATPRGAAAATEEATAGTTAPSTMLKVQDDAAQGQAAQGEAVVAPAGILGVKPIDAQRLATRRGGTDVFNDMQLKGIVADNRAVNVATGNNAITEGAFAGTSGLPMVVQNTGNNVLIQNATIVNVQVK